MLRRLRGWRCLIRTRRMAELTPFLRAPVHDLPCDQHVTYMSGVHHRHYRTWHVVHRPCVDVARVENDNIGLLARGECSDLVENAVRRGARNSGHLDDLSGGDGLRHRKTAWIALRKC